MDEPAGPDRTAADTITETVVAVGVAVLVVIGFAACYDTLADSDHHRCQCPAWPLRLS